MGLSIDTGIKDDALTENRVWHLRRVSFDNSYPTGGEALSAANLGFADDEDNLIVLVQPQQGFHFEYDKANAKLKVLAAVKKLTAALDPASMLTDAASSKDVTVTGVLATDICIAAVPVSTLEAGIVVQSARVSAADHIIVELTNASGGTVDAASGNCDFYVVGAAGAMKEVPDTTDLSALVNVEVLAFGREPV